jgi:hypothetical protein
VFRRFDAGEDKPERFSADMEFPTDEVKRSYRDALGSENIAPL